MTDRLASAIASLKRGGWSLGIEVSHAFVGVAVFLIVGARLGPEGYGLFAAILSAVNLSQPFVAGAPSQLALSRASGSDPTSDTAADTWRRSAGLVHVGGLLGVVLLAGVYQLIGVEITVLTLVELALAEYVFLRLVPLGERIGEATGSGLIAFVIAITSVVMRLVSALIFLGLGEELLASWAHIHLAFAAAGAVLVHLIVARHLAIRPGPRVPSIRDWRDGLPFALSLGPTSVLNDSDKVLLGALAAPADVGLYAAGYRIAGLALLPVRAIVRSTYPSFFIAGKRGGEATLDRARTVVRPAIGIGFVVGVAVAAGAPIVPLILGEDYSDSVDVVRFLAVVPILKAIQYPAANALTALGRHRDRVSVLLIAAALNVALNLSLIPVYGWRAALGSTLVAECLFAALLWRQLLKEASPKRRIDA